MIIKKHSNPADFLEWDELQRLIGELINSGKTKIALMVALPSYLGLRFSDYYGIKWGEIESKIIHLKEKKTGKIRTITISEDLRDIINTCKPDNAKKSDFLFKGNSGKPVTIQYFNSELKRLKSKCKINIDNFSTHTFRKSYGREVWKKDGYSEKRLILLSKIFNHSSTEITKIYLGITADEIAAVYESL
jgi:integrase